MGCKCTYCDFFFLMYQMKKELRPPPSPMFWFCIYCNSRPSASWFPWKIHTNAQRSRRGWQGESWSRGSISTSQMLLLIPETLGHCIADGEKVSRNFIKKTQKQQKHSPYKYFVFFADSAGLLIMPCLMKLKWGVGGGDIQITSIHLLHFLSVCFIFQSPEPFTVTLNMMVLFFMSWNLV